jgi:hypothetical protein
MAASYPERMEVPRSTIVGGAVPPVDDCEVEERTPVRVTDEELELIRAGQAAARRGELLDARTFLRSRRGW